MKPRWLASITNPVTNQDIINQIAAISKELGIPFTTATQSPSNASAISDFWKTRYTPVAPSNSAAPGFAKPYVRDRDKTGLTIADIPDNEHVIIRNLDEEQYVSEFYPFGETELSYERYNAVPFKGSEFKQIAAVMLQPSTFGSYQIFGESTKKNYGRYAERPFIFA